RPYIESYSVFLSKHCVTKLQEDFLESIQRKSSERGYCFITSIIFSVGSPSLRDSKSSHAPSTVSSATGVSPFLNMRWKKLQREPSLYILSSSLLPFTSSLPLTSRRYFISSLNKMGPSPVLAISSNGKP